MVVEAIIPFLSYAHSSRFYPSFSFIFFSFRSMFLSNLVHREKHGWTPNWR